MTCKICGKGACIESFHSIEEQEEFETKTGRYAPEDTTPVMLESITEHPDVQRLIMQIVQLEAKNKELKESISQCHQAYRKTSVYHRNRIKELEAGLRSILYESKSKAYSPKIVQLYAEQALK